MHEKMIGNERLSEKRAILDHIDDELAQLLLKRWETVTEIGQIKEIYKLDTFDPNRENDILSRVQSVTTDSSKRKAIEAVFQTILSESKWLQKKDHSIE